MLQVHQQQKNSKRYEGKMLVRKDYYMLLQSIPPPVISCFPLNKEGTANRGGILKKENPVESMCARMRTCVSMSRAMSK